MDRTMIYFDNSSTTRVDPEVADLVRAMMCETFGNPSSLHRLGVEAERRYQKAQRQMLSALGAKEGEVVFTSGGTEANNLAVFGTAAAKARRGNRVVTTAFEHSSVTGPVAELARRGMETVVVKPERDGTLDPEKLLAACNEDTILVSAQLVNNEVGTILPVEDLVRGIRKRSPNAAIHSDAVQAFCKLPYEVSRLGLDLMTVSAHKIHAPKGAGALYVAKGTKLRPLFFGGGQQKGLRPGTENMALIAGIGLAAERAHARLAENWDAVSKVRDRLAERLGAMEGVTVNSPKGALPYIFNISIPGYRSETMLHFLESKDIFVSSGSACSRGARSPVLTAMGLSDREIDSSIRISLSKYNTPEEADTFADAVAEGMKTLRKR